MPFLSILVKIFDDKISYLGPKLEMELVLHLLSVLTKEAQSVEIVHLGKKLQYFVLQLISQELKIPYFIIGLEYVAYSLLVLQVQQCPKIVLTYRIPITLVLMALKQQLVLLLLNVPQVYSIWYNQMIIEYRGIQIT